MAQKPNGVVFIHGLWLHASSWRPGRTSLRPDIRQPRRDGPANLTRSRRLATPRTGSPISGSTTWQRTSPSISRRSTPNRLSSGTPSAACLPRNCWARTWPLLPVAIDAAQIKGVLPLPLSTLRATLPVFKNPANKHKAVMLTAEQFRYAFGNAVSEQESQELFDRWVVPSPGRPLFEAAAANFSLHSPAKVDTKNAERGPLLLVMGGKDHTVPEAITKSTLKQYRHSPAVTELIGFEDRGHSLTVDGGWSAVADATLAWLDKQGL